MSGRIVSILSLYATAVLANPLRIIDENTLSPSMSNVVDAAYTANASTDNSALDTSVGDTLNIECNGALYGFSPNIADCENAAQSVMPDREQLIWGMRHTGLQFEFFPLPFAVFGGELMGL